MAIKYHQNGIEKEYGADHQLTNNWNPDEDYGNEYVAVKNDILLIRTINKTEQKQRKLFVA